MSQLKPIIVALDFSSADKANALLEHIRDEIEYVKIGMELFYSEGPRLLSQIKDQGLKIFLDLKLHDIPVTVAKSVAVLARHQVDMVNIHANGGLKMMSDAVNAYKEIHPNGTMIAVTQLTSTTPEVLKTELQITSALDENVLHLATLTKKAGLDGIVCSAHEVTKVKQTLGSKFICVTPGIRMNSQNSHDQKRVMTPSEALSCGADYLVMGREITQAPNPKEIIEKLKGELNE